MNRTKIRNYAPAARQEFISAVTNRAAIYGLTKNKIDPIAVKGDVALIGGNAFPKEVAERRRKLGEQIKCLGFERVMEAIAYTWFNRLVAIRYMELHGYFDHGYRVLSHPQAGHAPEILEHAERIDLAGLDKQKVIEFKLDATKEAELYRLLLVAQCNALNAAMPFLFERINDETELLLPDNLLHSDSIIRKLVNEIDEADWQEIEIIGWIYQFYISEKKEEVIGKVVKSEDIPAATQLFTPDYIVKYMVQNSLGCQWLATYLTSPLRLKMDYYIEPAEQTFKVIAQLKEITPASLNPEEFKLLDPACGSGHILVEGYDLLKEIYLERGYRLRDIPKLILELNLFGLEIDDRAAQLASFALIMKARADDRRIFESGVRPNIVSIQETNGMDIESVIQAVIGDFKAPFSNPNPEEFDFMTAITSPLFTQQRPSSKKTDDPLASEIHQLLNLFENGKTFGSLIRVPDGLKTKLIDLDKRLKEIEAQGELISGVAAKFVRRCVRQAIILADTYDAVVANPPYMGSSGMNPLLKKFAKDNYTNSKSDLFAMFIERGMDFTRNNGYTAMISMQSWMFLSSFNEIRIKLLELKNIISMVHLGAHAFDSIGGEIVSTTAFIVMNIHSPAYRGSYVRLVDGNSEAEKSEQLRIVAHYPTTPHPLLFTASAADFKKIPNWPIAYWVSERVRKIFEVGTPLENVAPARAGLQTGENERFVRYWHEVAINDSGLNNMSKVEAKQSARTWFPYNSGGSYRRWYGNNDKVVDWLNDGERIKRDKLNKLKMGLCLPSNSKPKNEQYYFLKSITWTKISSASFGVRLCEKGFLFDIAGSSAFPEKTNYESVAGFLCSKLSTHFLESLNPTVNIQTGNIGQLPWLDEIIGGLNLQICPVVHECYKNAKTDWDSYETSWDFTGLPLLRQPYCFQSLSDGYEKLFNDWKKTTLEMRASERENNRIFIGAYDLQDEIELDVPLEEITLICNPRYRYGGDKTEEELQALQRKDTMKELLSYSIGCLMGRYSLDKTGLVYAKRGNEDFDPSQYKTFPADKDGIVPLTELDWFEDDATNRFMEFVKKVWGDKQFEENLRFVAQNLDSAKNVHPMDTIRRYFSTGFFRDHLRTFKKRPIYWLFTSGKERAFQCLVYLHRYNQSTLSRMRTEYVIPLQGKINARIEHLVSEIAAGTGAQTRRLEKERELVARHRIELLAFDDLLRHYADQRIKLDLDDGVRVNYGKFGKLLSEVVKVTGGGEE